jgi:hypoxanthine-DNA glycosylase
MTTVHPIAPVWDENSRVLVLGSFPSVKSRETGFYYGHPQNRFWPLLARLLAVPTPQTIEEKKALLLANHIALWDVVAACEITGSSDSSIRNVVPNDLSPLLAGSQIQKIFCNGALAHKLYTRHQQPLTGLEATRLPSTSPANAQLGMERLEAEWRCVISGTPPQITENVRFTP